MSKLTHCLRVVNDFPTPNVQFIDINGLFASPTHYAEVINQMCQLIQEQVSPEELKNSAIISPESRGFFFSAPVAYHMGLPLLPIRKKGKIPHHPYRFHITNEYDSYDMEMDGEALQAYPHFIYIDDILATGQTLASIRAALKAKDKQILLALHLTAVKDLQPMRDNNPQLKGLPVKEIV